MANYQWFGKVHTFVYRASGGLIGHHLGEHPTALLYTVGAKSGRSRITPVRYYALDDHGIVIIASNNGQTKPPAWWFNIKAQPSFDIRVGRQRQKVRAELISGDRREVLWSQITAINPRTKSYMKTAGREIPVILLRRMADK
ncbi:deazaflavin-dependent oxidoreductase (nitroreductase family) [Sinobacterium caligoides]|uniref:Deazaflavin-dependent oxidoreductase (Nitroreductase family) n=1 Tax=Sinobacterium caligoides TaxID=933926 RepID=A0A3N2DZW7_9GAMM|nr:nitroreductase/quinone reductase family protein [Sinobacterium caligoides]ROS05413.1 deazaflavin-dependent oxidoreductase (nitroreductase family) [Sinobacterium caligoides]